MYRYFQVKTLALPIRAREARIARLRASPLVGARIAAAAPQRPGSEQREPGVDRAERVGQSPSGIGSHSLTRGSRPGLIRPHRLGLPAASGHPPKAVPLGRSLMPIAPVSFLRRLPVAAFLVLLGTWSVAAPASQADSLLAEGATRFGHGDLKGARESYLAALAAAPGRFTTLCRLARVESELAESKSGEDSRTLSAAAVEHAREAVKTAPDSANGHLELAVALGRQALREGPKTQLMLSREIKSEADRALALDATLGRAWHVLALWNRRLASMNFLQRSVAKSILGGVPKGASMDNAVADLEKAVELEPAYVNHRLELGRTYLQLKRMQDARRQLERAVELPPVSDPLDPKYQAQARELLAKMKKA
jgi:hypothetical protein